MRRGRIHMEGDLRITIIGIKKEKINNNDDETNIGHKRPRR